MPEINKKQEKKYYDIKIKCNVPAIAHYTILAESPEKALEEIKRHKPRNIKYDFGKRKESEVVVYDYMTTLVKLIKKIVGKL